MKELCCKDLGTKFTNYMINNNKKINYLIFNQFKKCIELKKLKGNNCIQYEKIILQK